NAPRAHDDVLGAGNADDLLQPRRAPRTRDLTKPLLRQRIEAGFRDQAKVAGERELEPHAEAVPPIGGDHRLGTPRRRGNVPGKAGDLLGCRLQEALDVAPAGEMLPGCPQYD